MNSPPFSHERIPLSSSEFLKKLAIPRKVGTEGEKNAQLLIYKALKGLGYSPQIMPFDYKTNKIKNRVLITIRFILFASLFYFLINNFLFLAFIFAVLDMIISPLFQFFLKKYKESKGEEEKDIKKDEIPPSSSSSPSSLQSSKNIYADLLSEKHKNFDMKMVKVILTAHYDSISYRFWRLSFIFLSLLQYVLTYLGDLIVILLFLFGTHLKSVLPFLSYTLEGQFPSYTMFLLGKPLFYFFLFLFCAKTLYIILKFLNKEENKSPGATDNGSGCFVVYDIAKRISESQWIPQWIDISFVFFGAEEWGLKGSSFFLKKNKKVFDQYKDVYVVNFDTIGSKRIGLPISLGQWVFSLLKKKDTKYSPHDSLAFPKNKEKNKTLPYVSLRTLLYHHAIHLNLPLISFPLVIGKSDHVVFTKHKKVKESLCFMSPDQIQIHSPHDTLDRVNFQRLNKVSQVVFEALLTIDKEINARVSYGE